jgi:hypothetical protein
MVSAVQARRAFFSAVRVRDVPPHRTFAPLHLMRLAPYRRADGGVVRMRRSHARGGSFAKSAPDVSDSRYSSDSQVVCVAGSCAAAAADRTRSCRPWCQERPPWAHAQAVSRPASRPQAAGPVHGLSSRAKAETEGAGQGATDHVGCPRRNWFREEVGQPVAAPAEAA